MKTDALIRKMVEWFENTDPKARQAALKERETNGFKRPSWVMDWDKFDMVEVYNW